ncbi:MAG: TIGR02594 family protein [Pyrinomonadaceae bacterium]
MANENYIVTASSLNVREAPSITGEVKGSLKKDEKVTVIDKSGDGYWFRVKRGNLNGWVSHKFLSQDTTESNASFPWLPVATAEKGVKEFPGNGDNPRIVEYLNSTNLSAPSVQNDETPWCSCFVNWCIERSGFEGTDSAWAKSWLNWGKSIDKPVKGCVAVFKREGNKGHVGFYMGETANEIKVLGGNQSDAVNESKYAKSRLLGYRLPN